MITMMLLHHFFIQKMEQQHGPQAVNQVQNIGKIEQITFLQLNAQNNEIVGTDIITYTNSPDTMSFIWMNLDQNLFKSDSRGNAVVPLTGAMVRKEKILTEVINPLKLLALKENLLKSMLSL
jgi:hypothetical protein